ncbi:hypothetical protein EYF80_049034 [Liparis tanakae]|uniref:Uncharacterized protein n=1 Tax=Liparis tanakae TaxID=230148 RepID=A0A4Z2FJ45_9TELE|nr:hypothetical protein EYF80_049034 [Liparis tanakae]
MTSRATPVLLRPLLELCGARSSRAAARGHGRRAERTSSSVTTQRRSDWPPSADGGHYRPVTRGRPGDDEKHHAGQLVRRGGGEVQRMEMRGTGQKKVGGEVTELRKRRRRRRKDPRRAEE